MSTDSGHGGRIDSPFVPFTQLAPERDGSYDLAKLKALADSMAAPEDGLSDGPDAEENLFMPAGYTYFGQFVDHDLTLDTTSTLNPDDLKDPLKPLNDPSNLRSPRFDLDCVYGTGPDDQPYMYAVADDAAAASYKGATLLIGGADLARAGNGRAIIGDKRNDENSIVNQIQQAFIRFHNKVVAQLAQADAGLRGGALFKRAQQEVRWAYQSILMQDYLPRIIDPAVIDHFLQSKKYELYEDDPDHTKRRNLPREFVAAAYRFGHSAVRTGYRLQGSPGPNNGTLLPIFTNPATAPDDSLIGFDPLPATHVIDHWGRFFPADTPRPGERRLSNSGETVEREGDGGDGTVRLQYAYKLDPTISDPLANLPPKISGRDDVQPPSLQPADPAKGPSLALLNLLRGNRYRLQGGQFFAAKKLGLQPLDKKYLVVRTTEETDAGKLYTFVPIDAAFADDTPLWFYILAEAQVPLVDYWYDQQCRKLTENDLLGRDADGKPIGDAKATSGAMAMQQLADTRCAGTRLGPVGGRIVAEVFYGLLASDAASVVNAAPAGWRPIWGNGPVTMASLLRYVDPATAP